MDSMSWFRQILTKPKEYEHVWQTINALIVAATLLIAIPIVAIERFSFNEWDEVKELLEGCDSGYGSYYSYINIQGRYKVRSLYYHFPHIDSWLLAVNFFTREL